MSRALLCGCVFSVIFACGGKTPPGADAGPEDGGGEDAGVEDAGPDLPADELAVLTSSTSAKLGEAWARGELSEDLFALYSFVGHLLPGAIPAQYRGDVADPNGLSQAHVRHAIARRASYTTEQQAMLDAVLARPGTPGFLRINNLAAGGASTCWSRFMPVQGNPNGSGAAAEQAIDTAYLRFIPMYPTRGDATDGEKAVLARIRTALDSPVSNTGDLPSKDHFKDYLDAAFEYLLTTHQLPDPRGLPDAVANGGKVPVYVFVCDDSTEDAFAVSNFGSLFMSLRLGLEDPALRKVVIPHELTHVFQHDAAPPNFHDAWPVEAFAVAMEHFMSKEVRRWSSVPAPGTTLRPFFTAMNRVFRCPEEPFHSANTGQCRLNRGDVAPFPDRPYPFYRGDYSRFVYFLWLAKQSGKPAAVAWWKGYVGASSIPTSRIPWKQLADFQMALLSEPPGTSVSFEPEDRARFDLFGAGLDYRTSERGRYTFRYEESVLKSSGYRAVPKQAGATLPPRAQDAELIRLNPGGTFRILVDNPATSLTSTDLSSVVYQPSSGVFPEVRSRFFPADGKGPSRRAGSVDLTGFAEEPGLLYLIPTGDRFLVATFTADPLAVAPVKLPIGVTLGPRCFDACDAVMRPKVPDCCPDYCSNQSGPEYGECVNSCNDPDNLRAAAGEFCTVYCWADNEVLSQRFAGTAQQPVGARMCGAAVLPQTTYSGLVPVTPYLAPHCGELGLPIGGS